MSLWGRGWIVAALSLGAVVLPGCAEKPKDLPATAVLLPAVGEPAGLAGEIFIPKPGTLWTKVKNLGGDKLTLLPSSFPMALAAILGLPPVAIENIEPDAPAFGAVLVEDGKELPVLAVHLRNGPKLVSQLTLGSGAKFVKKVDEPSGVVLLEPAPGETSLNAALGVVGDFLLIGYAPDGLLKLGPYVARTLPKKALPGEDVVVTAHGAALSGALHTAAADQWTRFREHLLSLDKQERERRGSAPTYGDPAALVGRLDQSMQTALLVMANLSFARASLTLDAAGGHLRVAGTPAPEDGVAQKEIRALRVRPAERLLALPDDVVAALLAFDDPDERRAAAKTQADGLDGVLGQKLGAMGRSKVEATLVSFGKGRGDALAVGFFVNRAGAGVVATFSVEDPAEANQGIRGLLELPKIAGISEPLRHWLGDVKIGPLPAASETTAGLVKLERKPPVPKDGDANAKKRPGEPPTVETSQLAWDLKLPDNLAGIAYAKDAKGALSRVGKEGLTLKSDGDVRAAVDRLGNDVSHVLLLLPSRLLGSLALRGMVDPAKIPSAPVVLSLGRTGGDAVVRLDAHPTALREMAKIRQLK